MIRIVNSSFVVIPTDVITSYIDNPEERELVMSTEYISGGSYHVPCILTFKGT